MERSKGEFVVAGFINPQALIPAIESFFKANLINLLS